jgi:hypothetical protein
MQEAWLRALEGGRHKQVISNLCADGGMCCLGVATYVVNPEHYALSHNGWDREDYLDDYDFDELEEMGDDEATAPPETVEALNLSSTMGDFRFGFAIDGKHKSLVHLNDNAHMSFPGIAAFIREKPWLVFTNFDLPEAPK